VSNQTVLTNDGRHLTLYCLLVLTKVTIRVYGGLR